MALQKEHQEIQANRKDSANLTWSEVNNMPYTAKVSKHNKKKYSFRISNNLLKGQWFLIFSQIEIQVISETLRKATILPWFSRKAAADFEIDGKHNSAN